MSENETQSEDAGDEVVELPTALVQFLGEMRKRQRALLKEKAFANPDQLRKFVAMEFMEFFIRAVEMLGTTMLDTHQLGVSNATQLQRMRRWAAKHLRALGAEVNDGETFPGVDQKLIDDHGQAIYALGSYLLQVLPNDNQMKARFDLVIVTHNKIVEALMGNQSVEDEDDEEEEEEDEEEAEAEAGAGNDESEQPSPPDGGAT